MHFTRSTLATVLSLPLFALAGCAGNEAPAKDKADDSAAKTAKSADATKPIVGKPVDGAQKVAMAPGGAKDEQQYALQIEPGEAKVGEPGKVSIRVVPKGEWHMNLEYPTKLEITAPAGSTVAKPKLGKDDAVAFTEEGAEFAVAFTPNKAGDQTFTGEFKFAVCQDEACVPRTEQLEFHVAVK